MDKEQAIIAMHEGEKVTHEFFSAEEWMTIEDGKFKFEDGCICVYARFWECRTQIGWNVGWSLYC